MKIIYNDLARAAFDNDAMTNEHGYTAVFATLDTDPESVHRFAEQRALRMVIAMRGPEEAKRLSNQAYSNVFSKEELTREEEGILRVLIPLHADGVMAGMRAMRQGGTG